MLKISSDQKKKQRLSKWQDAAFASSNVTTRDMLYCHAGDRIKAKLRYAIMSCATTRIQ